jgi:hypothetical protein
VARDVRQPGPRTVERLLRSLPEWFGIESSLVEYVAAARRMPAYLAWPARSEPGASSLIRGGHLQAEQGDLGSRASRVRWWYQAERA